MIDHNAKFNSNFLLLCGFEKFKNFYVRVDILEKLFIQIIEKTKDGKFQISSDMMNLIGCSKQNFYELMGLMKYKKHNEKEDMFKYIGQRFEMSHFRSDVQIQNLNPFCNLNFRIEAVC